MKKRGQKTCDKCGTSNGVRAYHCKECDSAFKMKKLPKGRRGIIVKNWKELEAGEYVRVVGRSGTYYIKESGEKEYFTHAGIYHIHKMYPQGISVVGTGRRKHGHEYLYMGKEKRSKLVDNMFNAPHKLYKVNYISKV
jgi:ribosomal protein L40E